MNSEIYTVGHSVQSIERFVGLLQRSEITAIADVRSAPYSRHNPQFNREDLRSSLKAAGIKYVFLGKELGARSDDECCYVNDKVQYALLAKTKLFRSGLTRLLDGATTLKIALMCAEKDPLDCHRTILVGRELVNCGCRLEHILADGSIETQEDAEARLVKRLGLGGQDMFRSWDNTVREAYDIQGDRIAYDRKNRKPAIIAASESQFNEGEDE